MRRIVIEMIVFLFFAYVFFSVFHISQVRSVSRTWIVDDDGPADFHSIQEAIDVAYAGDTIYVKSGTYPAGQIVLDKSLLLVGENKDTTFITTGTIPTGKGDYWGVVNLVADGTLIQGFTVINDYAGSITSALTVIGAEHCTIQNNTFVGYQYGIALTNTHDNLISDNFVTRGSIYGIVIGDDSWNNVLRRNIMTGNAFNLGIFGFHFQDVDTSNAVEGKPVYFLTNADNTKIPSDAGYIGIVNSTNILVENASITHTQGILVAGSSNVTIINTNSTENLRGIDFADSHNCIVMNCNLDHNMEGTRLEYSNGNVFARNSISDNHDIGIILSDSIDNTFHENSIKRNLDGVDLFAASENRFYHNAFINNTYQVAHVCLSVDKWDGGYPIGGNYWNDYKGTDDDHDMIGDSPYIIDSLNRDNYPLMVPYTEPHLGDVNDDGRVDILDIAIVGVAFGSYPTHPRYSRSADINHDGRIDIQDLAMTCRSFGWRR